MFLGDKTLLALASLMITLLLASCAGTPTAGGKVSDYSTVRVSGSVNRDFERSLEYLREENYAAAIELLQSVIEREKRLPAPYINLAIAYYKNGDEKHAEEALLQARDLDSTHPVTANELAVLYRKQGRFTEARKIYTDALAENPDYLPLIKNLGILCDLYQQDIQCALAQFEKYLSLSPEDKEVAIWVADLKRRAKK
ncbi:tetratricopeptide repeat protein [Microbulbifer thermotolerans]|uniref:Tetratricopeptide repeat protein n=1 Tax=Microbulbifer thermotolerans TaxID=252514 RepID=A0A143HKP1_MICTH|nr:tetratricopeptide repeat protein [Microbulbifer thermotolerans]AMX01832.1 hypothetical protein A3224_03850 [Microbulbifer thermotolerans]MCX2779281.1 tetratricopeptide repeat protein [Microbulbifer thermotolerans]MCX2783973.1 tetratricopeptide repeat protein [Microbulbifer thermotolerans]MCX2793494.1 tetratricopeptide repeat protein [Microbulbifer thermotolerans]MCX2802687.1 tetratricopeptide repeat protein [Microbulbifer thermotolerans]